MIVQEQPFPEKRMRGVFEELGSACSKFVSIVKGTQASGKTKLDKERQKLLIREMVSLCLREGEMKEINSCNISKVVFLNSFVKYVLIKELAS